MKMFINLLKNFSKDIPFFKSKKRYTRKCNFKILFLCFFTTIISCTEPTTSVMETSTKQLRAPSSTVYRIPIKHRRKKIDDKYLKKMRVQQTQLCKISDDFNKRTKKKHIAINKLATQLTNDIDGLLPRGSFEDWIMIVEKINSVGGNTTAVTFTLQCSLQLIGKVDSQDLFLKELDKGSTVLASGSIIFPPVMRKSTYGYVFVDHFSVIFDKKFNLSQK